jgi:hypothetical protein
MFELSFEQLGMYYLTLNASNCLTKTSQLTTDVCLAGPAPTAPPTVNANGN